MCEARLPRLFDGVVFGHEHGHQGALAVFRPMTAGLAAVCAYLAYFI